MSMLKQDLPTRFHKKYTQGEPDECWEWQAATNWDGYGRFRLAATPTTPATHIGAHVMAYILHYGPVPEGLIVLHTCDNPPCVNPNHLVAGTYSNNMDDMFNKRRHPGGTKKVSDEDVIWIRQLYASGLYSQQQIADMYGICQNNVSKIVLGQNRRRV